MTDAQGQFVFSPFPACNETGRPLELAYGREQDINCTIPELHDSLFHLFEFYIHNDAPLTCRVPSLPLPPASSSSAAAAAADDDYTPLHFALAGAFQRSHLHIHPQLNVLLHTTAPPPSKLPRAMRRRAFADGGRVLAATAYALPPTVAPPRVIIGDPLPLRLTVRWYDSPTLPRSTSTRRQRQGLGGHVHLSTVVYCLLSFGAGLAVGVAYFRGWDLPRRMKRYGERSWVGAAEGGAAGRGGYAFPGKKD